MHDDTMLPGIIRRAMMGVGGEGAGGSTGSLIKNMFSITYLNVLSTKQF